MTTIRAAVCRAFGEPLTVELLELAAPGGTQVQVRIIASAICHSDIHYAEGAWGGSLPAVYGHEAAGIVESCGGDVADLAPGDRVVVTLVRSCGRCANCVAGISVSCVDPPTHASPLTSRDGGPVTQGLGTAAFAERVVVDRSQLVAVDDGIAMQPAALLACGVITGAGAARNTARIGAGSSVVVVGTGGVGLNAVQGARLAGASIIVAVDIADTKLETARSFGATHAVNSASTDLAAEVASITEGRMADYVLVTVGAQAPLEAAPSLLAPNGAAVLVGMPASGVHTAIDPGTIANLNQRILGSKMGTSTIATDIPELVDHYHRGELLLDELITDTYDLDDINDAMAAVVRGDAIRNVILFDEEA